jgi:hypothetical protein
MKRVQQAENHSARTHPEFVVLDIGDDVGALIVHADSHMHGAEIEITPTGDDSARSHKDVLERSIDGQPAFTAVFDALRAGTYTLWSGDDARDRGVQVRAGAITQVDWRDAA